MSNLFERGMGRKTSRAFPARYEGTCSSCSEHIDTGDEVMFDDDELVHVDCTPETITARTEVPCKRCFIVHAGDCF